MTTTANTVARVVSDRAHRGHRRRGTLTPWAFLTPFGLLFVLLFVAPIGYAVYQSLIKVERSGSRGLGRPREVFAGLENYQRAVTDPAFVDSVLRVLLFAVVQVPLMIVLATTLALLLDSASARWPGMFRAMYFLPYGVPGVVATILWGFLYVPGISPILNGLAALGLHVDLLGSSTVLWSIANIVTWSFAGYNMLVIIAQLKAIPGEIYEAAVVDGAGPLRVVWHVKLPLVRPALVLTTVFTIIGTLQLFAEPLVLKSLSTAITFTYTPNLAAFNEAFNTNNYGQAAAESVLLALGAFVLSFGFLRIVGRRGR